ncbi:hypothetical protein GM921_09940 [Pedobacter sp. LMG 31464]|uniref:Uncharacterized protein n=1 Tax=Pedobacter planticolens TaxID=2679964 RepID=A0A923DZU0_9SPHI|nr:hypothetical protein [Pedobacter planticolens]MBB2145808.1 hypothetical protein [Pedobacter planticolens]
METAEQKRRRIIGKQKISDYLIELNNILKINVSSKDLLTIEETDFILSNPYKLQTFFKKTILFEHKAELESAIVNNILESDYGYFIFISDVLQCGAIRISSLNDFNFNFSYDDLNTGIISIVREDLSEKITLDFYEENWLKYIEIELFGR